MKPANLSVVPFQQASLCLDCETITAAHTNCLACGSRALLNIARVLSHRPSSLSCTEGTPILQMSVLSGFQRKTSHKTEPSWDRGPGHEKLVSAEV